MNSLGETSTAFECLLAAEELARIQRKRGQFGYGISFASFIFGLYTLSWANLVLAYDYQCETLLRGWFRKHESRDDNEKPRFTINLGAFLTGLKREGSVSVIFGSYQIIPCPFWVEPQDRCFARRATSFVTFNRIFHSWP